MDKIFETVSTDQILVWVLCLILFFIALDKYYPRIKAYFSDGFKKEQDADEISKRVTVIEKDLADVKQKQNRDYYRLNDLSEKLQTTDQDIQDSKEERQLILSGLLAALKGLQELGTNGPTREAQGDIEKYLNKKAHE